MSRIAFLGLGAMGRRMAAHLIPEHDVTVWNRTASRAEALVAAGARQAETPREAVADAELVFTMLTDDDAARGVWLDPEHGALAGMQRGTIALESSTVTPAWIGTLGAAADSAGVRLIDAPVAGSTPQAEAAALVFLLGGRDPDVAEVDPVLAKMGAKRVHAGPRGHGATLKLMVNTMFATQVAALAELLQLAETQGMTRARALELLAPLPVTAPAAAGVGALMVAGDHAPRFPVDLVAKDLGYAHASGAGPLVRAAADRYQAASDAGHGGQNLSAVVLS